MTRARLYLNHLRPRAERASAVTRGLQAELNGEDPGSALSDLAVGSLVWGSEQTGFENE